ncbi:COG3014 family protein [Bdellovibrio sp. HCB288]|uniref:COG3014 family protein n=1 Tax=Bdellovibrio sp. HCB288 TaxID=3394355 RepID=UPI0039B4D0B9
MTISIKRLTGSVGLFFILLLSGCATYQGKVDKARTYLVSGDSDKALKELEPLANTADGDQLVYLLDYGVALQVAGNIPESNTTLLRADRLSEQVDYQSVSRVAGSLALSQEMVQYKGDTFEKIFINAYLAMNFLEIGKLDDALVEARRINEKYQKYRQEEKQKFELNPFSKYLSALIWEADRSYDDAYIAYQETYKLDPTIPDIGADLIRSAKLARRPDAYKDWKKKFPEVSENPDWYNKSMGELVIIYQQGWGPRKYAAQNEYRLPALYPTPSIAKSSRLTIDGEGSYQSHVIYDVQAAAIKTLNDDHGILIAKRLAGIATKAVLADQVRQQNQLLGDLTFLAMNLADRADLRQWSTLPQTIQIIRVPLKAGEYKFNLEGLDVAGNPMGEALYNKKVVIKPGQKNFIVWRSVK